MADDVNDELVVVGLEFAACDEGFVGHFSVRLARALGAANVSTEEVAESIRGGLRSQRILCRSCLAARSN